jgi:hypothetical protein
MLSLLRVGLSWIKDPLLRVVVTHPEREGLVGSRDPYID